MMRYINKSVLIILFIITCVGCDLTEEQVSTASRPMIFGTESGLLAYTYSFYDQLPDYNTAFKLDATAADYAAKINWILMKVEHIRRIHLLVGGGLP